MIELQNTSIELNQEHLEAPTALDELSFEAAQAARMREWIEENCAVEHDWYARPKLTRELFDSIAIDNDTCTLPLSLLVPMESLDSESDSYYGSPLLQALRARNRLDDARRPYFCVWRDYYSPLESSDAVQQRDELVARLMSECSPGEVEVTKSFVRVSLGQRRPSKVSDSDICALLFLSERTGESEQWSAASVKPYLYQSVIEPYFRNKENKEGSPFEWAVNRLAIVNGYAQTLIGRDYPLLAAEVPYKAVAPITRNTHPDRLESEIKFLRTEQTDNLLQKLGENPLPESVYFVLSLKDYLSPDRLKHRTVQLFLEKLPTYLEHGLCIDRVVELVHEIQKETQPRFRHLAHALSLVDSVYGTEKAPWWFKEDCLLVPQTRASDLSSLSSMRAHRMLAREGGYLYQYSKDIWENGGSELLKFKGIELQDAINLTKNVTEAFGIGNLKRAERVITFARAALAEVSPEERSSTCLKLIDLFLAHKPASEVVGALEGSKIDFEKPGINGLLLNAAASKNNNKAITSFGKVSLSDLKLAVRLGSEPLEQRASRTPRLSITYSPKYKLLSTVQNATRLPLPQPVGSENRLPLSTKPVSTWIDFDRQVRDEVSPAKRQSITEIYLHVLSHKFPNPLSPPAGFLRFMEKYASIYDPNYQPSFMFAPHERAEVRTRNAEAEVDRWALIASWFDTAVMGMQSYQQILNLCNWVVFEDFDSTGLKREAIKGPIQIQKDVLWDAYWNNEENRYRYKFESQAEHDRDVRQYDAELYTTQLFCLEALTNHPQVASIKKLRKWVRRERASIQKDEPLYDSFPQKNNDYEAEVQRFEHRINQVRSSIFLLRDVRAELINHGRYINTSYSIDSICDLLGMHQSVVKRRYDELCEKIDALRDFRHYADVHDRESLGSVDEQSNQERSSDELRYDVSDAIREERLNRYRQLGGSMGLILLINSLRSSHTLTASGLEDTSNEIRCALMNGELSSVHQIEGVLPDQNHLQSALTEIRALGLVNFDDVEIGSDYTVHSRTAISAIVKIHSVATSFLQAKAVISEALKNQTRNSTFEEQPFLVAFVERILSTSSIQFAPSAAQQMVDELHWIARYQAVTPHVQNFLDKIDLDERYSENSSGIGSATSISFRTAATAWMFHRTSVQYRQDRTVGFKTREAITYSGQPLPTHAAASSSSKDLSSPNTFFLAPSIMDEFALFKERVRECRLKDFGLLPVGGKIHVLHAVDTDRLNFLRMNFNFGRTTFRLDNANDVVLLPPTPSSAELQLVAEFLNSERIIDWEFPEIQMCIPGRLGIGNAAFLGASIMAATDVNVPYQRSSFATTHNETAFRIMIYDANGERGVFPFNVERSGRTDMLGRRTLSDFNTWQLVGSVLSYAEEDLSDTHRSITQHHLEEFHRLATWYKGAFRGVLRKHQLHNVLGELWLNPEYLPDFSRKSSKDDRFDLGEKGGARHYERGIKPLMDAWNKCADDAEFSGRIEGVVGDAKALEEKLRNNVRLIQDDMLRNPYYERHRAVLLQFV